MYWPPPKHQRLLESLRPSRLSEFIVINIFGSLIETRKGNRFIVTMMDRYRKWTRTIPYSRTTTSIVESMFLDNWIILYEIPNAILRDSGFQFASKCFAALHASVKSKLVTTAKYHSQTNGQVESIYKVLIPRMQHFIHEHQTYWDFFKQPIIYGDNTQMHRTRKMSLSIPFSSRVPRKPSSETSRL